MPEVPDAPTAERLVNELSDGRREHEKRCKRFDHAYDVYRAAPPKGLKRKPWESKLRVKYGMQVADTALVNIVGGVPRAKVRPRREQDVASAEAMQYELDYHVAEDHLAEKQPVFVQQGLIYGVTGAKNHWIFRDRTIRKREFLQYSPDAPPLPIEREERVVLRDGPTFEPWDVYDFWWEPNARDVDGAAYVALRSWLSKDELRKNTRSERNPNGLFDPPAVEALLKAGTGARDRTTAQERFIGGPEYRRKDRFEVVEVWRDEVLTIVGAEKVILGHKENPYWFGRKPVVIAQPRPDLFELLGISEMELLEDLQEGIQSLQNMRIDNAHLTVMRGFTYRDTGLINPAELELKPRFKWPVGDHDDIRPVEIAPLPPEAWREDEKMLAQMQLVTGINPYVSGADLSSVDQNTATGVTALQEVASRLLKFKARQLALKGFLRTFEMWNEMVQQFKTDPIDVRIDRPDGSFDWKTISPQDVVGNHDLSIEGVEEALSRQTERAEAIALLNAFAPFAQAPGFNFQAVLERVAKAYDMPPKVLFTPPQPMPPAAPYGPGGNGQAQLPVGGVGAPPLDPRIAGAIMSGGGTQ